MMLRRKAEVFAPTDGVLSVCTDSSDRELVGADFSDPTLLDTIFPLSYRRMRVSARDVELADTTGSEITAKVEVRSAPALDADTDVTMGGKVYEITRIENRGRTSWLWLSEIACDGTCDLVSEAYVYDAVGIPSPVGSDPITVYVRRVTPGAKRRNVASVDALANTLSLRIRACDYRGERQVVRNGVTLTVLEASGHGRWVDLTCRERGADRG